MTHAKALLIDLCHRRVAEGMSPVVSEAIIRMLWPAVRLLPRADRAAAVGGSRIGGLPDLPGGTPWPVCPGPSQPNPAWEAVWGQPLSFLLQVNLAEIAPHDEESALPHDGLLSFFFLDTSGRFDRHPDHGEVVRVMHTPPGDGSLRPLAPPPGLLADEVFRGVALEPRLEWTVPEPYDLDKANVGVEQIEADLGQWDDLREVAAELQGFGPWNEPRHRLLGHPDLIQGTGMAEGVRLLLQVDSDVDRDESPGMMWGDAGRVYFFIAEEDLAARNFDRVWAILEMS